jgi:hypothetical protein
MSKVEIFTTVGSTLWTPDPDADGFLVTAVGGGGGGGHAKLSTPAGGGGGGGSGAFAQAYVPYNLLITPGETLQLAAVNVGGGGAGGSGSDNKGADGTSSELYVEFVSAVPHFPLWAEGGIGGGSVNGEGGHGWSGGGGGSDIATFTTNGGWGGEFAKNGETPSPGGAGGTGAHPYVGYGFRPGYTSARGKGGVDDNTEGACGGGGGAGHIDQYINAADGTSSGNGLNTNDYGRGGYGYGAGGGGGGGSAAVTTSTGGDGAAGVVIIQTFYANAP